MATCFKPVGVQVQREVVPSRCCFRPWETRRLATNDETTPTHDNGLPHAAVVDRRCRPCCCCSHLRPIYEEKKTHVGDTH
jgi:hypothetical protein